MQKYGSLIRKMVDFPQKGIVFQDINPLLANWKALEKATDDLTQLISEMSPFVTKIVAVEARGFIVGGILAQKLGAGFVPVRKKGKLPPYNSVVEREYSLEYGSNCLELDLSLLDYHDKIVVFDDVLATGGTASAVFKMLQKANESGQFAEVNASNFGYAFLLEIEQLAGKEALQQNTGLAQSEIISLIKS